jgi:hypothetical protein
VIPQDRPVVEDDSKSPFPGNFLGNTIAGHFPAPQQAEQESPSLSVPVLEAPEVATEESSQPELMLEWAQSWESEPLSA